MNEFSIELAQIRGKSELFSSFTNEIPKSSDMFVNELTANTGADIFFVDRDPPPPPPPTTESPPEGGGVTVKIDGGDDVVNAAVKTYYQIRRPQQPPNDVLYLSVKGGSEDENEFQVLVYNRTVVVNGAMERRVIFTKGLFMLSFAFLHFIFSVFNY